MGQTGDWKTCIEFGKQTDSGDLAALVEPWYLAYVLLGASAAGLVPMLLPLAVYRSRGAALTARLSQGREGEGMGLFNATTGLAGITGAALGGWVTERWGYHIALGLPVVGIALGSLLALTVRPVRRSHLDLCPGE
ncbi:MAG: hypothetical protein ACRERE_18085 [Candidatus Entotheonellia bacterium]